MQETSTAFGRLGNLTLTLTSEVRDEQMLDTKVEIEAGTICWICGEDREKFAAELSEALNKIVDKYRI